MDILHILLDILLKPPQPFIWAIFDKGMVLQVHHQTAVLKMSNPDGADFDRLFSAISTLSTSSLSLISDTSG